MILEKYVKPYNLVNIETFILRLIFLLIIYFEMTPVYFTKKYAKNCRKQFLYTLILIIYIVTI